MPGPGWTSPILNEILRSALKPRYAGAVLRKYSLGFEYFVAMFVVMFRAQEKSWVSSFTCEKQHVDAIVVQIIHLCPHSLKHIHL